MFIYYPVETFKFLQTCISGLSKLIFKLLRGRVGGENCHFHLRSTTSGPHFVPTILIPLRYDAMNELKMRICNPAISVWRSNHLSIGLQLRADFSMLYIHSTDPTAGNSDNTFQFYSKKNLALKNSFFEVQIETENWPMAKLQIFLGAANFVAELLFVVFNVTGSFTREISSLVFNCSLHWLILFYCIEKLSLSGTACFLLLFFFCLFTKDLALLLNLNSAKHFKKLVSISKSVCLELT